MQNQKNKLPLAQLALTIITPDANLITVSCDSVHIMLRDDLHGHGGGAYGIRPGHAKSILALGVGAVTALSSGETVLRVNCGKGFVKVSPDSVAVITEYCNTENK